jgi:hypothetical protein
MITLYGFGSAYGLPDASPFVTKVEMLLKMAKPIALRKHLPRHLLNKRSATIRPPIGNRPQRKINPNHQSSPQLLPQDLALLKMHCFQLAEV